MLKGVLLWGGFFVLAYLAGTAWHMGAMTQGVVYGLGSLTCLFLAPSGSKNREKAGARSR